MEKKTALTTAKEQMKNLLDAKAAQLRDIQVKLCETKTQAEAADTAVRAATEKMDLDAYEKARAAKRKAKVALDMYSSRYTQLQAQEVITEAESDAMIDGLLDYEKEVSAKYEEDIAGPLKTLCELTKGYLVEVADIEATIKQWGRDVRANYSTRGTMTRVDPETGERTDLSEVAVPVHAVPYRGCDKALTLETFLKNNTEGYLTE